MRRRLTDWIAIGSSVAAAVANLGCTPVDDPPPDSTDTDGDGLSDRDEVSLYGTSPVLADTDGDGWSDFAEVVTQAFDPANDPYRFNPLVADIPLQTLVFISPPDITLQFTDAKGATHILETSTAVTNSVTNTNSATNENSQSNTVDTPQTSSQDTSVSQTFDDAGAGPITVTNSTSQSQTVDPSTTIESSVALTQEQAQQYAQTLTQAESFEERSDITVSAGILKLVAVLKNHGHLPFRVINMTLGAALIDGPADTIPVDNLEITEGDFTTFQPFSLAPGEETGPLNFVSNPLTLETTQDVLVNVGALVVQLGAYELDDATGKSYAFNLTEIGSKTAIIDIDYGGALPPESHLVATNIDPSHPGITAEKAVSDILRIPFDSDPRTGLTVVRDVGTNASGTGSWQVECQQDGSGDPTRYDVTERPYDFKTIEIHAGDVVHLAFHKAPRGTVTSERR